MSPQGFYGNYPPNPRNYGSRQEYEYEMRRQQQFMLMPTQGLFDVDSAITEMLANSQKSEREDDDKRNLILLL